MNLFTKVSGKLLALVLVIGILVRILLICITPGSLGIGAGEYIAVFALGLVNDLCIGMLALLPMWMFMLSIGHGRFKRPVGYILLGVLVCALLYVCCFNTVFDEYGSVVPTIAKSLLGFWTLSFTARLLLPGMSNGWNKTWFWIIAGLYVFIIYFNAAGEYFFWDEFNVRYNFIAVDYLIYTNEVVGNIMESYAMVPLMITIVVITAITTWLLFRKQAARLDHLNDKPWKLKASVIYLCLAVVASLLLPRLAMLQSSGNVYYDELQANGAYKFFDAFTKNHLDYTQFYYTLDDTEAEHRINAIYGSSIGSENSRVIMPDSTTRVWEDGAKPNIVLITMESMSASFMERYGDDRHLTPSLDSLALHSLTFDQLIATGNRTVRGLEALSLSLPPSPGESIIKRPDCVGLRTTGVILSEMGYRPMYFYGGNSYFDNMGTFFGGNGYEIVDIKNYTPGEIVFQNIWGVADESSYDKLLKTLDETTPQSPVFAHLMTISNHRPYTYPAGRISIPNDSKKRAGGVMYADYALGRFMEMAREHEWFDNTVFIIVADHCASSAGKSELPIEKYHIPAMIYAPGKITPQAIDKLCSQIDLIPTLFALLGYEYQAGFYGQNILSDNFKPRAFLATYENLGYLENDTLTILSPVRRIEQFKRIETPHNRFATEPVENIDTTHVEKAAAYYQTTARWYSPERTR